MAIITRPCYCSREAVKRALDVKATARSDAQVDRAIEAASDAIDGGTRRVGGLLKRRFYPEVATRYFDWPAEQPARSWRLWLNQHELVAVTELVAGGTTIPDTDYFLRPDDGPPYTRIEIDLDSSAAFGGGSTPQRDVAVTGVWGYDDATTPAGQLAEALDATETAVDVTDSNAADVGDLLLVGDERMLVTGKSMLDTGQVLGGDLAASNAATSVTVADGSAYYPGEVLLIDGERLLVVDIAGNTLIVRRGWDGSTLAAHTAGADIYAPRTLTVARGAVGTTAAAHSNDADVDRHVYPGLVRRLAVAYALDELLQESSGYARTAGQGENAQEYTGRGIRKLEADAVAAYGRVARIRAV